MGQGITGWVAEHRIAQNLPNAAADPRANTIPGTEEDLDESMLLAPMMFEDEVLGVLVLSKLGLDQFSDDDLRLLVIYASFAAQAMANADTTERLRAQSTALERQLRSQRELLADHRIDPHDARRSRRPRRHHRAAGRADRLRQRRRSRSSIPRPACCGRSRPAASTRRTTSSRGSRRDRPRDVGRRPQRTGLCRRRAGRPAGQPLPRPRGPSTAASSSCPCVDVPAPSVC